MQEDAKKALKATGLLVGMIVVAEHAYAQEKSMLTKLMRLIRG